MRAEINWIKSRDAEDSVCLGNPCLVEPGRGNVKIGRTHGLVIVEDAFGSGIEQATAWLMPDQLPSKEESV